MKQRNTRRWILAAAALAVVVAAAVLAFARALGEYGATAVVAGYVPGRTATVGGAVWRFWSIGDDGESSTTANNKKNKDNVYSFTTNWSPKGHVIQK